MERLFKHCEKPEWKKYLLMFKILYYCMRRVSEVVQLRCEHILVDDRKIIFYRAKRCNCGFVVTPPDFIISGIEKQMNGRSKGWVFASDNPRSVKGYIIRQTVNQALQRVGNEIGLNRVIGMKPIRNCKRCGGSVGLKCKYNNMRWITNISPRKWLLTGLTRHSKITRLQNLKKKLKEDSWFTPTRTARTQQSEAKILFSKAQ